VTGPRTIRRATACTGPSITLRVVNPKPVAVTLPNPSSALCVAVGTNLSAAGDSWRTSPAPYTPTSVTYEWWRGTAIGGPDTKIGTGTSYTVTSNEKNRRIWVRAIASNSYRSTQAQSSSYYSVPSDGTSC
jgi:hypothetical protein